jgi:iron complex outermembrane receptor protein
MGAHRRCSLKSIWLLLALTRIVSAAPQPDTPQSGPAALKSMSLEELSQIEVVTPSKEPVQAFKTPVAIYVITGDDIRRSGATTIPEALRLAPGVEVARIDGSKWSVGIRGFGTGLSRSVLVLMDGRSVYTPLFAGTYWDVQDTLMEDVDRIEVIRGPGGTIWGPNAVNGVINIITKSTKDTLGTFASLGGGNEEQGFANFRYGGGNGKGLTYRIYGKGYTRGPEYHFAPGNFDDWRGARSGFRMDWSEGDRDTFRLQGDIYKQEDGERVQLGNYTPPSQRTIDANADLSGGNILATWTRKLSGDNSFQVQTYYDRTNRYEPNLGERRDTFDIDFIERTKLQARHELIYGLGARFSEGRFLEAGSGLVFSPANRLDYLLSGFFEDDITLVDGKLLLTLGTKLLRTNYTSFQAEPSVRLLWTASDKHTFWASFSRAIRTPSRAEHDFYLSSYLGPGGGGVPLFARFNANPDFANEQLNGWEAGYRTLIRKNFFIDVAGFWNHYHDLFSQDLVSLGTPESTLPFPEAAPPPAHTIITAQFRNDLYGFTSGYEIAPEWRPARFWRLRASYSYLNMNLSSIASTTALGGNPASVDGSSPRHEAGAQSAFDISKKVQLDLTYRYVSALRAVSAPAYSTGDARIAWRFSPHMELSLFGRNLLQPRHVEYTGDPGGPIGIRRSAYASVAWTR